MSGIDPGIKNSTIYKAKGSDYWSSLAGIRDNNKQMHN